MTAMMGWVLLAAACWPVLSKDIETGATQALGLLGVCLAALTMIAGIGDGVREWVLLGGLALAGLGEVMHWRSRGRRWRLQRILSKLSERER